MLAYALIAFAVAAVGGLILAAHVLRDSTPRGRCRCCTPPWVR